MKRIIGILDRPRGQSGYLLLYVVGFWGLLALVFTALFGMTMTALRTSDTFGGSLVDVSAVDSAMHRWMNELRYSPNECNSDLKTVGFGASDNRSVILNCAVVPESPDDPAVRTMRIWAKLDNSGPDIGTAQIRVVDVPGTPDVWGEALRICDWQLGQNVVNGFFADC